MSEKASASRIFPFQMAWTHLIITGATVLITSKVAYQVYYWMFPRKVPKSNVRKLKENKFVMPPWGVSRASEFEPPQSTDTEERLAAINRRKPPEIWNTVLFFPDRSIDNSPDSPSKQLVNYFSEAKHTIFLCMYLCSHFELTDIVLKKYREGLLVQVITDYDTWQVHNNCGAITWGRNGIEIRMKNNGYFMHNKFAIIDGEAVLTGSLNWTKQGVHSNNENVMITTDQRIVSKYEKEFDKLWVSSDTEVP